MEAQACPRCGKLLSRSGGILSSGGKTSPRGVWRCPECMSALKRADGDLLLKYLSLKELLNGGFLQEANRQFFHPLGLALEVDVQVSTDGAEEDIACRVQDHRQDPEGVYFGEDVIDSSKAERVAALRNSKEAVRTAILGHVIQSAYKPVGLLGQEKK